MERKALYLAVAVLLGLTAAGPTLSAVAEEPMAAKAAPGAPQQGLDQHGAAHPTPDAPAEASLESRLTQRGMKAGSPVMIRIFKKEAELELWIETGGRFELFATYTVCNWSGTLGPKLAEGDKQSPEGLYSIGRRQLRHSKRWRHSLDIGYPNAFDRSLQRTGSAVLLHGGCTTTGCFAMTNPVIEEIYRLCRAALAGGQERIQVHVFPFRMTPENLAAHADVRWDAFWANLKEAYDVFERTRQPPAVRVCNGRYVIGEAGSADPGAGEGGCLGGEGATAAVGADRPSTTHVHPTRAPATSRRPPRSNALRAHAAVRRARLAARTNQRRATHTRAHTVTRRRPAR